KHFQCVYIMGLFGKGKTALNAPIGSNDFCLDQFLENFCEKRTRDLIRLGYLRNIAYFFVGLASEVQYTADSVITFAGNLHSINYIGPYFNVKGPRFILVNFFSSQLYAHLLND